jgi:hypothetical protein
LKSIIIHFIPVPFTGSRSGTLWDILQVISTRITAKKFMPGLLNPGFGNPDPTPMRFVPDTLQDMERNVPGAKNSYLFENFSHIVF